MEVLESLKDSLDHLKDDISLMLNFVSPKEAPTLEIERLADILTDRDGFRMNNDTLQSLIVDLAAIRKSGVHLSMVPLDQEEPLRMSLQNAALDGTLTLSAGVVLLRSGTHISLESTSPFLPRWNQLDSQALYYPFVALSELSQDTVRTFSSHFYGGPPDQSKACFDGYRKVKECLLRVWCLVFDHRLGLEATEQNRSRAMDGSATKTESKDDVKPSLKREKGTATTKPNNGDYIKTEFPDIVILPTAPKRRFMGVSIGGLKRKRPTVVSDDDAKPDVSPSKKLKREVKEEEENRVKKEEEKVVRLHEPGNPEPFQVPAYPPGWPASILQRLIAIPSLDAIPNLSYNFMGRTFDRLEFSKAFGGPSVAFENGWNRTPRALREMPGLGGRRLIGAIPEYNVFLPHAPCAPGLIFRGPGSTRAHGNLPNELLEDGGPEPRTVFVRIETGAWLYVGEYRVRLSNPLEEWMDLKLKDRMYWKASTRKFFGPESIKRHGLKTVEALHKALDDGTRMLEVYTMECVAYHEGIQRAIHSLPRKEDRHDEESDM